MAHLLFVKAETARNGQDIGDFVLAYDFEPTATEKALFEHIEAKNVTAAQVMERLEARKDEAKDYPKFAFHKKDLLVADVTALKDEAVDEVATLAVIDKFTLKKGTVRPVEATIEK